MWRRILIFHKRNVHHRSREFTKDVYNVKRSDYNKLNEQHIESFKYMLKQEQVLTDNDDLAPFNIDFRGLKGSSKVVLRPKTTEDVSEIVKYCNKNRLAVCPHGGNTGLSGGAIPIFDEIIISLSLMNKIEHVNAFTDVITCQAGCVLQDIETALEEKDLIFPLDLGSAKGACQIGGNVATNAGGLRLLRYGNLHGNVLGLEVVKGNGDILDCLNTLRKDNTGYHLKNLFIGSEGTLGIITRVAVQCQTLPKSIAVAFLGCANYGNVLKTFRQAKRQLGEVLSAFEVLDAATMEMLKDNLGTESPIGNFAYYVMVETSGSNSSHDSEKLESFLTEVIEKQYVADGTYAMEPSKLQKLWGIRESVAIGVYHEEHVLAYDLSLPLENYFTIVDDVRKHTEASAYRVFGFGHMGDGNVHLQVSVRQEKYNNELEDYIESYVLKRTNELGGSISAEHGIGFLKVKYLPLVKSPAYLKTMRNIKRIMDPNLILNPYKVLTY